ncbi:4-hydroxyphenylacetate catabolism regulatory protein HpaA [Vogesella sp. GCM10023246]|uniref:4-hydroxyphenylacetate catabolism regulatory protein HpaA n=1 Tax=Vogesella oryzagri TaxID=3160864 RepID=A0ABV1M6B2_9NEIS
MARERTPIPNIDIGKEYDSRYAAAEVSYERFGKLAEFFGRNMPVHRHDRFFQVHYLASGQIRLYLEEQQYIADAPLFFLTPPTVPHAFITEEDADGHVLTVRQELVWQLLASLPRHETEARLMTPFCVELGKVPVDLAREAERLPQLFALLGEEYLAEGQDRDAALHGITQLLLVSLLRLSSQAGRNQHFRREDLHIYHRFNALIEQHYREHWALWRYAEHIGVTEARLNDICRRLADLPSKRLVHDRLLQEAKRLLIFSASSINEIAYHLGFKDPAYFSRFFLRDTGRSPSDYRAANRQGE